MGKHKYSNKQPAQTSLHFNTPTLFLLPFVLLTLIYPFLAQYNSVQNPLSGNPSYYQTEYLSDIFLCVKAEFLLFITICILCIFGWYILKTRSIQCHTISEYKPFIPLGIYGFFIIISSIFAQNKHLAFNGMTGIFENMWVLLSYLILCIFGYWYTKITTKKSTLIYLLLIGTLIMGTIFLFQFLGADPYVAMFASQNATVAVSGVYGGFFNPNYLGSYVNLILPLLIVLCVAFRKNKNLAIAFGVAIALTLLGLLGSKTTGGIVALVLISCFTILFFILKKFHLSPLKFLISIGALLLSGIIVITAFLSQTIQNNSSFTDPLKAIYTCDDYLEIHHGSEVYYLSTEYDDTNFTVTLVNKNGDVIPSSIENGGYLCGFLGIKPYILPEMDNLIAFGLTYRTTTWMFTNDYGDGSYYYITPAGGFTKTTSANTTSGMLFTDLPTLLSGRGYIWSQSIPMLKDTLLLGYGPDNYAELFPNNDFVGLMHGGFTNTFISKPHNMYLQIAIQTGVPSLLAFLVFYLIYFVKSVQIYQTSELKTQQELIGFGIFLGTLGYLTVGLINDSSITVAPFFWLLLGIGYALNELNRHNTSHRGLIR